MRDAVTEALALLGVAGLRHDPVTEEFASWLERDAVPATDPPQPLARSLPLFEPAVDAAQSGPGAALAAALGALVGQMRWTQHSPSDWAMPFADRMATGMIVGPVAPVVDDRIAFGAFVVAADTFYPEHGHSACELYLTLSGDPLFLGRSGWVELSPGLASIQEPDAVHALRTRSEPALFFWAWTGDLHGDKWSLDEHGERFYPPHLLMEQA